MPVSQNTTKALEPLFRKKGSHHFRNGTGTAGRWYSLMQLWCQRHFSIMSSEKLTREPVSVSVESVTKRNLPLVADCQMFAVVTADPGCGKSTLIRRFYSELPKEDYIVLYLSDSKLTPRWFYKGLLDQLGLESRFYRGDSKRQLQQEIEIIRGVQHKKVVCILDEAHLIEKETLEEFRFLLNYRFDSMSPMAVVLVGQTELWENKLKLQRYAAIRQRIDMYLYLATSGQV